MNKDALRILATLISTMPGILLVILSLDPFTSDPGMFDSLNRTAMLALGISWIAVVLGVGVITQLKKTNPQRRFEIKTRQDYLLALITIITGLAVAFMVFSI